MKKFNYLLVMALVLLALVGCKKSEPSVDTNSVKDICGNTYKIVVIGTQTWMAESMRCANYDTESEAYKAGIESIPIGVNPLNTPYYVNASDKSLWDVDMYAGSLSADQIAKLGYAYNWAAAVGLEDGSSQTTGFTSARQGICPNGWHIPTDVEFHILVNTADGMDGKSDAGKKLKSTSGWYVDEDAVLGVDTYGFNALPSNYARGTSVNAIGYGVYFQTATNFDGNNAYYMYIPYEESVVYIDFDVKNDAYAVRCVKN